MLERPARHFVALDLETTGLLPESDRIVEIGAIRFDEHGQELARFEQLVNPGRRMSPGAQAVHGISDADLANAPPVESVLPAFLGFLGSTPEATFLAHNASFDAAFLGFEIARSGLVAPVSPIFDTLALALRVRRDLSNHKLDTLARVLGLSSEGSHRALADSIRVMGIWLQLGGPALALEDLTAYPMVGRSRSNAIPVGWEWLPQAIAGGQRIRMEYDGGRRIGSLREITPRELVHRGGVAYLVAYCHLDAFEKSFRLDRVKRWELL
ncbi:MAG: exonuclease domain-containing protein [Isosphaeraceae bacterium]